MTRSFRTESISGTKIQVVSVYGGTNLRSQVDIIRNKGCNILVGTPGRLLQILREGRFRLCKVKWVVLDEAHRLLESMEDEPAVSSMWCRWEVSKGRLLG